MQPVKKLPPNGQMLFSDLNNATDHLMAFPIDQIGSPAWQALLEIQQESFKNCQKYLWEKAALTRSQPLAA